MNLFIIRSAFILLALSQGLITLRADRFDHHFLPVTGEERAVLVLCPGMNGDGAFFLEEEPWVSFAREHQLGLLAIHYRSAPEPMYTEERQGYYWPEQGSGPALLEAIETHYGKPLPIVIYGFSGGAQFASRLVEWAPERIITWAAYSAQFWDPPQAAGTNPPGIVACGEHDGVRWFPSFAYFYQGRELGKPWTWVSIRETGHVRHREFEAFVREYFACILRSCESSAGDNFMYVDVGTEEASSESSILQPGLLAWLPDASLMAGWHGIHEP